MKLVADANVLFSLAKSGSVANDLRERCNLRLVSPDFALIELHKYSKELLEISGETEFSRVIESLKRKVVFVDNSEYKSKIKEMGKLIKDKKDVAHMALARSLGLALWSNDLELKEQSIIEVLTTRDLVILLSQKK